MWQKSILERLSKHYETGECLPDSQLESMIRAKHVNVSFGTLRQIYLSRLDLIIHGEDPPKDAAGLQAVVDELRPKITLIENPAGNNMLRTFGHLMNQYSASYYGYLWAEVISADMFACRFEENCMDTKAGMDYRKMVLAPGGTHNLNDHLTKFLGRAPSNEAFLKSRGISDSNTSKSHETCASVAGVWTRLFEEDPLGDEENADRTTLVVWTQTPVSGIYVDLRLPKGSPGRSDSAGSEAVAYRQPQASALRATHVSMENDDGHGYLDIDMLTRQKSFAGVLTFTQGDTSEPPGRALEADKILADISKEGTAALPLCTCVWRRHVDYQPPSGGLDVGVCASYSPQTANGMVHLRETGDDGSYAEGWSRMGDTNKGPFMALELVSEVSSRTMEGGNSHTTSVDHKRQGYWVRAGHRFAYAIGRPETADTATAMGCPKESATVKDQVGKSLGEVIAGLGGDDEKEKKLALIGSYVGAVGEVIGVSDDKEAWRISDSTHPGLVDCHLVGEEGSLEDSTRTSNCCSILRGDTSHPKEGDIVEQVVSGSGPFVRKWRVVELSGCELPFVTKSKDE